MNNDLSQLLKTRRLALHQRIEDVSESSNVTTSTISRLENGLSRPTVITLVKLAYGLSLTANEIAASLGADFGNTARPKVAGAEQPLSIRDVEAFLDFASKDVIQGAKYLQSAKSILNQRENAITSNSGMSPLPYPPNVTLDYLREILLNDGVLTFSDATHFVRKAREAANMSFRSISIQTDFSFNTIGRLERDSVERHFLNTVIKLDQILNADGLIFDLFWAAGEFHSGVIRNKAQGRETEPPLAWTEEEHTMVTILVNIERWSTSLGIPFLSNLRNVMLGYFEN